MTNQNIHGLSRHIPEDIKREVRQRCKFGCVRCRCVLYQYEHIDPLFSDAREHDPDNICLLCGHCHDKVTRGQLSKETVARCYEEVNSSEKIRRPFDDIDLNSEQLMVTLGGSVFKWTETLIELDGTTVLAIEPPEDGAVFPTLTGLFTDDNGSELLRIERNVLHAPEVAWDFRVEGRTFTVFPEVGKVGLQLTLNPPNQVVIDKLDMRVGQTHLELNDGLLRVGRCTDDAEYYLGFERIECKGARIGVQVDTNGLDVPKLEGFRMAGGDGIRLLGTGVNAAVGAGSMVIRGLTIEHATPDETIVFRYPLECNLEGTAEVLPPRLKGSVK